MLSSKVLPVGYGLKVLSVGYDHQLLQLRSLLLRESLQIDVLEAFDIGTAVEIAGGKEPVDLIVLCHTVAFTDQVLIIDAARKQHAGTPVMSISPGMCISGTPGTPVSSRPDQLVTALRSALFTERVAARRAPGNDHDSTSTSRRA